MMSPLAIVLATSAWGEPLVEFYVLGKPASAGSKRVVPVGKKDGQKFHILIDANKRTKPWQQEVKNAAFDQYDLPIYAEPVGVCMMFYEQRPKAHYRTNGELKPNAPKFPNKKPDVLKLGRAIEDALSGIVFRDDSQVVDEHLYKRYARDDRPEGVRVLVWKL